MLVVRSKNRLEIQVVLDTATQHRLPLSNVLGVLGVERLQTLNLTTKVNERYIHTIECQFNERYNRLSHPLVLGLLEIFQP